MITSQKRMVYWRVSWLWLSSKRWLYMLLDEIDKVRMTKAERCERRLHDAVNAGKLEAVRRALDHGVALDARPNYLPLFGAALHGHLDIAALLLERGASAVERNYRGYVPLHAAVMGLSTSTKAVKEMVELLLQAGADPAARNVVGKRPIDVALRPDLSEVVALLRAHEDARSLAVALDAHLPAATTPTRARL